jgi:hypothetical protein
MLRIQPFRKASPVIIIIIINVIEQNMPRSISNTSLKEPLILNNTVCDSLGRTLVGVDGTKYVSGSSLLGSLTPEIREILICPGIDCGVDSSHSPVVYSKVGEGGSGIESPYNNTTDVFCQLGSRISQASNEAFLHIPARSVPTGWGVYAYQVYVSIKDRGFSGPQDLDTLRTAFISRKHKNNINNSSTKTDYLTLYHDATNSTNSLQTFANNTFWNPNIGGPSYGIIWIAVVNNVTVITGGRCLIRRV